MWYDVARSKTPIWNTLVSEIQTSCCTQLTSVALKVPGPLWATFPDNIRSFLLGNIGTWIILFCLSLQYKTMSAAKQTSVVWDYFTEMKEWQSIYCSQFSVHLLLTLLLSVAEECFLFLARRKQIVLSRSLWWCGLFYVVEINTMVCLQVVT